MINCTGKKQLYCAEHTLLRNSTMAYTPNINTHGKPYGAYPYGVTAATTGVTASQAATYQQVHMQKHSQGMQGTLGNSLTTTTSSGWLGMIGAGGQTVTTSQTVTNNGGIFSVTINPNSVVYAQVKTMPFTKDVIDKLKAVEPRIPKKRMPDYIEPITAWRAWCVQDDNLHAIGTVKAWEPKKALKAECIHHDEHDAPISNCTCGIWSFKDLDRLLLAVKSYNTISVIGKVSLWGKIIETENGYRAQFAYPKELWLLNEKDEELGLKYNVPVRCISLDTPESSDVK